jgi:hypothetical protein
LGLPVICIDARLAKAALKMQINKSDRNDTVGIARIMQCGWYKKVRVKDSHAVRALLASRALLVKIKRDLENRSAGSCCARRHRSPAVAEVEERSKISSVRSKTRASNFCSKIPIPLGSVCGVPLPKKSCAKTNLHGIVSNRNISALMQSRDAFHANDRDAPTLERAGFIFAR